MEKRTKPLSADEIMAVATVAATAAQLWQSSACRWADLDTVILAKMAASAHWFGCIERQDQLLLIPVLFKELLVSIPDVIAPKVMEAFMEWIEEKNRLEMAALTQEQREQRIAVVREAAKERLDSLLALPH